MLKFGFDWDMEDFSFQEVHTYAHTYVTCSPYKKKLVFLLKEVRHMLSLLKTDRTTTLTKLMLYDF